MSGNREFRAKLDPPIHERYSRYAGRMLWGFAGDYDICFASWGFTGIIVRKGKNCGAI
jgi:hypothetical protein